MPSKDVVNRQRELAQARVDAGFPVSPHGRQGRVHRIVADCTGYLEMELEQVGIT
jgi:hypothetical protein